MRKWVPLMLFLLAAAAPVFSDGMMVMTEEQWRQHRERSMINEPEQKAVVFFSKGTEQLIISPSYEGSASSFAWLIPVPSRPKVEILKGAIFHELAKLVIPKRPDTKGRGDLQTAVPKAAGVTVIERKTVGAYDVSVLSATDSQALMKWLATNKYHLPPMAEGPVRGYIADKWTFVACRVKTPSNAKGLQTGTLAPLRFTFKTKKPVYPLKLSSANPKPFDLLVYLVLPTAEVGGAETISVTGIPRVQGSSKTYRSAVASGYAWKRKAYPTLAGLYKGEMQIYVQRGYPNPWDCTQDIYWTLPSRSSAVPGGEAAKGG